jgi:hypothetical protein
MSEKFGEVIDKLDNLAHALQLPLKDSMHVNQLRRELPEVVKELKAAYVFEFVENPWEGEPE